MEFPPFNPDGDLPVGIYSAGLAEVTSYFGVGTPRRCVVAARLQRIYQLAVSTGKISRFVVFGSFVTNKAEPNDDDIVMLMDDEFDVSTVSGEAALVFQHQDAEAHFGASIFWCRQSSAIGGSHAMIEFWQNRREGGRRGIVEIVQEKS